MHPIRPAIPRDLPQILLLMRRESNAVGFLPTPAVEDYICNARCLVATHRHTAIAYLLGRPSLRYARWCRPITHLVVHPDFRRKHVAARMLDVTAKAAIAAGQTALQAWTRRDLLPALFMWQQYAWDLLGERTPDTADAIPLLLWRHRLTGPESPDYWTLPKVAGHKAARLTTAIRTPDTHSR